MAWFLGTLVAGGLALDAPAGVNAAPVQSPHGRASLVCEHESLTPGKTTTIGVVFEMEPKWHIYWPGRNDSGVPPTVEFDLPAGYSVEAVQWPAPVRHVDPGDLLNHVYFDRVMLLVPLKVPASAAPGTDVTIKAHLTWLICDTACVAEEADVKLKMPVVKPLDWAKKSSDSPKFEETRKKLAREVPGSSRDLTVAWTKGVVTLSAPGASRLTFFPYEDCVPFAEPIKDGMKSGNTLAIRLGDPEIGHTDLKGVLEVRRDKDKGVEYFLVNAQPPKGKLPSDPRIIPTQPSNPLKPTTPDPDLKPVPDPTLIPTQPPQPPQPKHP